MHVWFVQYSPSDNTEFLSHKVADRLYLSYSQGKALSNKASALTKSMNMDIWVGVTSNQLFIRGSYTETNFSKKKK